MLKYLLAAALSIAIASVPVTYVSAQTTEPTTEAKPKAAKKKLSAKQLKRKECNTQWKDYKKVNNVKGKTEYNKFMKTCTTT